MLNKLKPKSEFSRNVLTLMTGTTIAQAIPIAISPILTRIYTPEDFGVFALFIAITSILGSIANGRYELAIMLPEKDEDAINIFALGFIITIFISIFLLIVILIFHDYFVAMLNNESIGMWLYFVPIAVFFMGLFNILNYFNTRKKNYKDIANSKIIKSIVLAISQLIIGFIKQGVLGLISGQLLSQIFANWQLLKNIINNKQLLSTISLVNMQKQAKEYISFPKFSLFGVLANILSVYFINILISAFFSVKTLGFYSFSQKILGMPSSLIGGSIGQVYFQKAMEEKYLKGNSLSIFLKTLKKSVIIASVGFGLLYFTIEDIFSIVFGETWRIAGIYAQIVIPFFYISFISSVVSTTYDIYNRLKLELIWQLFLLIGILIIFYLVRDRNFIIFLKYMNYYGIFMYLISLILTYQISKGKDDK